MSDPAIEAAQRAWADRYHGDETHVRASADRGGIGELVIAAAREALAPIRELHRPNRVGGRTYCEHCVEHCEPVRHAYWPCRTAKLIHTTEELER